MTARSKVIKRGKYISLEVFGFVIKPLHTSLISLLVIRLFNIELWGQFVFFLVGIELLNSLLNWGQKPFLLRKFSLKPNEIGTDWSKAVIARFPFLIILLGSIALIPAFQLYFIPLLLWGVFRWLGFLFEALIQYHRKYWWTISAEAVAIIVAISCIFFSFEEVNLEALIYTFAFSSIARFLVLTPLLSNWKPASISFSSIKEELILSFPFFALSLAGLLQTKGELYVATYLLQEQDLGAYQIIISFLLLGQTLAAIVLGPFQKNIYRWQGNDIRKLKKIYLQIGFVLTLIFSTGLYAGLQLIYVMKLSAWFIPLFFAYLFPLYLYFIESQLLLKNNQEKKLLQYNIIAASCNIVVALLLIHLIGIFGALLSGIICRLILAKLVIAKSKMIQDKNDN